VGNECPKCLLGSALLAFACSSFIISNSLFQPVNASVIAGVVRPVSFHAQHAIEQALIAVRHVGGC
jgi:hypothetical protein